MITMTRVGNVVLFSVWCGFMLCGESTSQVAAGSVTVPHTPAWSNQIVPPVPSSVSYIVAGDASFLELLRGGISSRAESVSPSVSDQFSTAGVPCSAVGCLPNSSNENEDCAYAVVDTVNGGCMGNTLKATPLQPFDVMCGQTWAFDDGSGPRVDTDWYITDMLWDDSLTWRVTAEFDFEYELWQYPCVGGGMRLSGTGLACQEVVFSARTSSGWPFSLKIVPSMPGQGAMPCNLGPWNYHVSLEANCEEECPPGSVDEGEGCSTNPSIDNFNGGCFSNPPVYSTITPDVPICDQISEGADGARDTDWYRTAAPLNAGTLVTWSVTSNFPHVMAIFDQRRGCITREIGGVLGNACYPSRFVWVVDSTGVYTFIVGVQDVDLQFYCPDGPWTYTAELSLCNLECEVGGVPEGEPCLEDYPDEHNGGCNSPFFAVQPIALNEVICGQSWLSEDYRDTDWFEYHAVPGEVVRWTVTPNFPAISGVVNMPNGCGFAYLDPVATSTNSCEPFSITVASQNYNTFYFFVAPDVGFFGAPPLHCANGPWRYNATLESAPCVCDCHADPVCDGILDILDVAAVVSVAFRDGLTLPDPSVACPATRTDVDCSSFTDIIDVTRVVNVAFRNGDSQTEFCNPCVSSGRNSVR